MTVYEVVEALQRMGCRPRPYRGGWISLCPVHELDGRRHNPSLSVREYDGRPYLHCFAGCQLDDIRAALGIESKSGWQSHSRVWQYRPPCSTSDDKQAAIDWSRLYDRITLKQGDYRLKLYSQWMPGTSPEGWYQLQAGWYTRACAVPMFTGAGIICGYRLRYRDGQKRAVRGSKNGLFVCRDVPHGSPIVVVEGCSDTAAIASLKIPVVGLPSAHTGHRQLVAYVQHLRPTRVVLALDADEAGQKATDALRRLLWWYADTVVLPIAIGKDVREWAAADKDGLQTAIWSILHD